MQTIYNMETRVLTLFDDEEFYPKEEPKKKPKKEPVTKAIESENITQQPELQEPELHDEIVKQEEHTFPEPATGPETFTSIEEVAPAEESAAEIVLDSAIIDEPEHKLPEEDEQIERIVAHTEAGHQAEEWIEDDTVEIVAPDETIVADELLTDTEDNEEHETEINAADDELNKQILSELLQVDYASLIHKDYPFDMSNASVVDKNATSSKEPALQEEVSHEEEDNEVFEDIVPLPEWKLDKKYYTIGEVAQLFAVNTSHIRFWTNEFKLKPRTTRKGDRLYSPKDIAELRLIHHLVKEKKHTIKGAREKLKAGKNDVHNKLDLKDSLINLRDTLLKIKEQL